ncbi:hypothetical protein [Treponema endosymbiont of Eucomonympha sp.]|uniref:hypothetical protein n=1 Tax=Treponema endosymbiont of Eucomonympha sp. TaxID=1580831 RepID=UPI0013967EF5|nr:hypothetical protein [Treponema endosymbiont of Eucomonympha sp.]
MLDGALTGIKMRHILVVCICLLSACLSTNSINFSVQDILKKYPESEWAIGIGKADSLSLAENEAKAELAKVFKVNINSSSEAYSIAYQSLIKYTSDKRLLETIAISSDIKNLIGVTTDIYNIKNSFYVCAKLNKKEGITIYKKLIKNNEQVITALLKQSSNESDKLTEYKLINSAYSIADLTADYISILSVLDSTGEYKLTKSKDDIKLTLMNKAKNITFNVDMHTTSRLIKNNAMIGYFSQILTGKGFHISATRPDYDLNIDYTLDEANYYEGKYKFVRYELKTNLYDRRRSVLVSFNANDRVGHASLDGAIKIALIATEEVILTDWSDAFNKHLNSL